MRIIGAKNITEDRKHYGSDIRITVQGDDGDVYDTVINVWMPYGPPVDPDDEAYDTHYLSKMEAFVASKLIERIVE